MKKRQPDGALALAGPAPSDLSGLLYRAVPLLLVVGAWLLCHPFQGIVHDGRLYVAQALYRLQPDIFGQDVFFAFGSQDDFTLFSVLFAPMVQHLGPAAASLAVVAIGQVLWLSGAAALILRMAPDRATGIVALLFVVSLPAHYGGWNVFAYGEGFATPRLLAEGFSMWALWALARRQLALTMVFAVLGGLLHPLVTATMLVVGFLFLALEDRRWLLAGLAGAAAVAVAAVIGVAPFDRMFQTMDAEWRSVVEARNTYLFPTLWASKDWGWLALATTMSLAGTALLSGWPRRMLLAATLGGWLGLLATLVGGDLLGNLLVIQIQPYRTLWLLHLSGYVGAGVLFVRLWRLSPDGPVLMAAILLAWLLSQFFSPIGGAALGIGAVALALLRLRGALRPLSRGAQAVIYGATGLFVVVLVIGRVFFVEKRFALLPDGIGFWSLLGGVTVIDIAVLAIVAFAVFRLAPNLLRTVVPGVLLVTAVAGVVSWDRRDNWPATGLLAQGLEPPPFAPLLAKDAQVYWQEEAMGPWLLLGRPSYVSWTQGASMAFNREMALTIRDRAQVVKPLANEPLIDLKPVTPIPPPSLPDLTREMLADACRRDGVLDAMVLSQRVDGVFAAQWDLPYPIYDTRAANKGGNRPPIRTLYLYRCADLR